jgi:Tfp pilus assembly protein PilF
MGAPKGLRRLRGDDHPEVANFLHNRAGVYEEMGQLDRARREFARALEIRRERLGAENPLTLESEAALERVGGAEEGTS